MTTGARTGSLAPFIGAVIAVAVVVFRLNGGEHMGKKTVNGDNDLPPVATGTWGPNENEPNPESTATSRYGCRGGFPAAAASFGRAD